MSKTVIGGQEIYIKFECIWRTGLNTFIYKKEIESDIFSA